MRGDYEEKILSYLTGLGSLTVFREINGTDVFKAFNSLLTSLLTDDTAGSVKAYHRLTYLLLEKKSHRLCGNIFADYILEWITDSETVFSSCARNSSSDDIVRHAARADLDTLFRISRFSTGEAEDYMSCLSGWAEEDNIQSLTNAVWNGEHERDAQKQKKPTVARINLISWAYEIPETDDAYSDAETLRKTCDSMMQCDAESALYALEEVFATCGTGIFLKYRLLVSDGNNLLAGKNNFINTDELLPILYAEEYENTEKVCRDFANGSARRNIAICGSGGSGKTTMALATAESVPELHFVYVSAYALPDIDLLLQRLSEQPLRFAVIVDDLRNIKPLKRFVGTFMQPENVMFIALMHSNAELYSFDVIHKLAAPELSVFTKYICNISFGSANADSVRNMCMDYQIETKKPLSYAAVKVILGRIK